MVTLAPLVKTEELQKIMGHYSKFYTEHYLSLMAKKLGLDAIHDTVHEMCKDEARHGKAFEGLLKRYFK